MGHRRLEIEGRFSEPPSSAVSFDGHAYSARPGEPWFVTLLAHGVYVVGRSSKYHRPRGIFCGVGSCGQCVARADGLPNVRLCVHATAAGSRATSQNTLGTARFDMLAAVDWLFAGGLDHHHLMTQSSTLNRVAVATAGKLAGLGRLPDTPGPAWGLEPLCAHVPVAVVGGGVSGMAAASATRLAGLETWVLEALPSADPNVRGECRVVGFYDDRELVAREGQRLLRLRADAIILATGGYEQPPPCPGNDIPGVMARRAAEIALSHGVLPGRSAVVVAPPGADPATKQDACRLIQTLSAAGAVVTAVGLGHVPQAERHGERLIDIDGVAPQLQVRIDGDVVAAEVLIWCPRPLPAYELPRQMGIATPFSSALGGFLPRCDASGATARDGIFLAGELAGIAPHDAASHGARVGAAVASTMRRSDAAGVLV